ncbi:glycosyltransferase family 9 protein [Deltaproteobacteria bacterium TL4]
MKILIIRFSSIGDLVLTTPIYRELKRLYPQSHVTLLTSKGFGEILSNNPHLDETILHPRQETWKELRQLIQRLKQESFSVIYDAHRSLRSRWIVWNLCSFGLKRGVQVWSINKRSWQRELLVRWKINFLKNGLSQREHLLEPLQRQTSVPLQAHTELFPSLQAQTRVQQLLKTLKLVPKRYICIGPSASFPLKAWPFDYFKQLIQWLLSQHWEVILVGGAAEIESQFLAQHFEGRVHNLAGELSLLESAELLKHAFLAICNDTSIGHIAEAMRTPAFVFFGPTARELGFAPFLKNSLLFETPLPCRPCSRTGQGECQITPPHQCLTSILPEKVFPCVEALQQKN